MEFITIPQEASAWGARQRSKNRSVGFVPTMGALHKGHMSLINRAKQDCGSVVCSVFVNPLQFNNPEDLAKYPRQVAHDRAMLERAGCDAVFVPVAEELYAGRSTRTFDLGGLDFKLEGASRPGHFQGVANVIERLFHFVRPDAAFFGEKDRQQLAVIRRLTAGERWPVRIVGCPTLRESNGLAMSSRNQRLSPEERELASVLFRALSTVQEVAFKTTAEEARQAGLALLAREPVVRLDHLEIVDSMTLDPLADWGERTDAVCVVAAFIGPVRLIDNITLRR
ncbi:MAG: pantoate--beta-alanine ligase [Flavobacteriales bacterium]|nr:MAG: pantoate--beta-alanine ligase [Flavobacteriales bacterium]